MRSFPDNDRLQYLLEKYTNNTCSREEMEELFLLIGQEDDTSLQSVLQTHWDKASHLEQAPGVSWDRLYGSMLAQSQYLERTVPPLQYRRRRRVRRVAVALALLLIFSGAALHFWPKPSKAMPVAAPVVSRFKNEVQPGGNKAILTLSDGSSIVLDSAGDGTLSMQGNTKVLKLAGGRLAYQTGGRTDAGNTPLYNTISTPKGGQYQVVLPDGSKVWLDATSSIRFPTSFDEKERQVELSGEAYFEVAANPQKPFIVSVVSKQKNGSSELQKIAVLGTRFNVMAYEDENVVKTTLLDGAVSVAGRSETQTGGIKLQPGEQAQQIRSESSNISVVSDVDVDATVAWKNGYFNFNRADIHTIMRQLSRWYDVEVVYQGSGSGKEFWGGMQRDLPLTAVFRILEKSGVEFSIDGKKVMVNL
ncbi:MAG: FecR domain-containing protein [Bacteroidetes bacterium]|nr:FecR domain-containing protein [Bacteroidota bacterium]